MPRNKENLYKLAKHIEDEPTAYHQGTWGSGTFRKNGEPKIFGDKLPKAVTENLSKACGTRACMAGSMSILAGAIPPDAVTFKKGKYTYYYSKDWETVVTPEGEVVPVMEYAKKKLGLTSRQADYLFHGDWTPALGMTVPEALRAFADGKTISQVTDLGPMDVSPGWLDEEIDGKKSVIEEEMEYAQERENEKALT